MYRDNYINSLREEMIATVEQHLSPVALRYGYSEVPLETNIKWRPLVLVLGNYSSGKSTLINDFLGAGIQSTGQAPTDDCFTVITHDGSESADRPIETTEERDGRFLLNDPEYPFDTLKKYGQQFASHFRLKRVNSPFLSTLALIDTPGMLDSITERDRGYDYQQVIGDLAQMADLVLVLFDPHKAGTVREAHLSLRDTLPLRTFEDRVIFVLNRVDECTSLADLLRVYGTLCWNLSQMTGRKDIPPIHLTYATAVSTGPDDDKRPAFLHELGNERGTLKTAILQAPRMRLDNLASFVETHSERLTHMLEALASLRRRHFLHRLRYALSGIMLSMVAGGATMLASMTVGPLAGMDPIFQAGVGALGGLLFLLLWISVLMRWQRSRFHRRQLRDLDALTPLENQTRRDSWQAVKDTVSRYIEKNPARYSLSGVREDHNRVRKVFDEECREIREALSELSGLDHRSLPEPRPNSEVRSEEG